MQNAYVHLKGFAWFLFLILSSQTKVAKIVVLVEAAFSSKKLRDYVCGILLWSLWE